MYVRFLEINDNVGKGVLVSIINDSDKAVLFDTCIWLDGIEDQNWRNRTEITELLSNVVRLIGIIE